MWERLIYCDSVADLSRLRIGEVPPTVLEFDREFHSPGYYLKELNLG